MEPQFYSDATEIYADLKELIAGTQSEFVAVGVTFDRSLKHHARVIDEAVQRGVTFKYLALSPQANFKQLSVQFDQSYDELKAEVDASVAVMTKLADKYKARFLASFSEQCPSYRIYVADPHSPAPTAIIVFYGMATDSPHMPALRVENLHSSPFASYGEDAVRAFEKASEKKVFIIHGHNEARWRELEKLLLDLDLEPVILAERPSLGASTIIEKFEHYASKCVFACAVFTPDDLVEKDGHQYLQTRPNVIFELGWFYARLGRRRILMLLQEGTEVFSDIDGILLERFHNRISERFREIQAELSEAGMWSQPKV